MIDGVIKEMFGQTSAIVLPSLDEDAPHAVREGIARRRLVMTTGSCPCGARMTGPNRAQRRQMARDRRNLTGSAWQVEIRHETDCPAVDGNLEAELRAWGAR